MLNGQETCELLYKMYVKFKILCCASL